MSALMNAAASAGIKPTAAPIDVAVDSTFIPYIKDGVAKIVFQHEHEDFWQALRTRGVLPSQG